MESPSDKAQTIIRALLICARSAICPEKCPYYSDANTGIECTNRLMEMAAYCIDQYHTAEIMRNVQERDNS